VKWLFTIVCFEVEETDFSIVKKERKRKKEDSTVEIM
jgi:hypothetical protein